LLVKLAGLTVEEIVIPLQGGDTPAVRAVSPNGLVPYMEHQGARIWESLAIAEYCAEIQPNLWPAERMARAHARAISAEMHAGFRAMRNAMPMNLGRNFAGVGQSEESLRDVSRIDELFTETRHAFGGSGPFLFGDVFNAADAMFAPVVTRLLTYAVPVSGTTAAYCNAVWQHEFVKLWYELAAHEPPDWRQSKYEDLK
jgi:glutathione S-transferase